MDAPISFTFAKDAITQLITLSTGVIGVSVTFAKDINSGTGITASDRTLLRASWIVLLISIVFGVWALLALTGTAATSSAPDAIYGLNVTFPTLVQIGAFLIGIGLLIRHASK